MSMSPLNSTSGMPQMYAAFQGWTQKITLDRITQTVTDGLVTDVPSAYAFEGTIQPLGAEELLLKPEASRAYRWLQIHCVSSQDNLTTNDRIIYNGVTYKIMKVLDYALNNYMEYHAIEDYQASGAVA